MDNFTKCLLSKVKCPSFKSVLSVILAATIFCRYSPLILLPFFSLISDIQINIQEYNHIKICISDHGIKCAMS